jgi:dTDP-4-dehydrorhamnose reductase
MSTKQIMLLGANGQIGQALQHKPLPEGFVLAALSRADCDITDHRAVQNALQNLQPALVLNAAAMTNVDACEKDPALAAVVNFEATANLASQCSSNDIPLIQLSTDYVFDGRDGGKPYTVSDMMCPLNVYGESKMMGEEAIRQTHPWHIILRVSSVFSAFAANILTRTLNLIETKDELRLVTDQIAAPTYAPDIATALLHMAQQVITGKFDGFGTFHLTGEPATTRLEFAEAILEAYAPYATRRPKLLAALSTDFPGYAERPVYSVLDCSRIRSVYGIEQKPWRAGVIDAMAILMKNRSNAA